MGIFSFLKSKKPVELKDEIESMAFEDIGKWVEDKKEGLKGDEQKVLEKVGEKLELFYVSLEGKLEVLEGVDIESKKEHGRAKLLVRQGLDKYIDLVHILLKDLKATKKENLEKFIRKISETFVLFEKTSAKVYERATYLVGDEMAAVRNEIRRFYNGLIEMFEGEDSSIKDLVKIKNIKLKLEEFEKLEGNVKDVEKEIEISNRKIGEAKKKVERLMEDVERIKNSSEYISNLKTVEEIKALRVGLDREIAKLKELIDFKKLTSIIHSNERELKIVKDYREHFVSEFSRDGGAKILNLLGASNMKNSAIESQVSLIEKKDSELKEKRENIGLDSTVIKLGEVKKIEDEIDGMETKKVKVRRRLEEFDLKLKGLRNEVVKMVEGFGVKVI